MTTTPTITRDPDTSRSNTRTHAHVVKPGDDVNIFAFAQEGHGTQGFRSGWVRTVVPGEPHYGLPTLRVTFTTGEVFDVLADAITHIYAPHDARQCGCADFEQDDDGNYEHNCCSTCRRPIYDGGTEGWQHTDHPDNDPEFQAAPDRDPKEPPTYEDFEQMDPTDVRASELLDGDVFCEYGGDPRVVAVRADHGDSVLITDTDGVESTLDGDMVVERAARMYVEGTAEYAAAHGEPMDEDDDDLTANMEQAYGEVRTGAGAEVHVTGYWRVQHGATLEEDPGHVAIDVYAPVSDDADPTPLRINVNDVAVYQQGRVFPAADESVARAAALEAALRDLVGNVEVHQPTYADVNESAARARALLDGKS